METRQPLLAHMSARLPMTTAFPRMTPRAIPTCVPVEMLERGLGADDGELDGELDGVSPSTPVAGSGAGVAASDDDETVIDDCSKLCVNSLLIAEADVVPALVSVWTNVVRGCGCCCGEGEGGDGGGVGAGAFVLKTGALFCA